MVYDRFQGREVNTSEKLLCKGSFSDHSSSSYSSTTSATHKTFTGSHPLPHSSPCTSAPEVFCTVPAHIPAASFPEELQELHALQITKW